MSKCKKEKCKNYNTIQQDILDQKNKDLESEVEYLKKEIEKTNHDLTRLMHAQNEQMDLLMEMVQNCLDIVLKNEESK